MQIKWRSGPAPVGPGIFTYINPYSYLELRSAGILEEFTGVYLDGMSAVLALKPFNRGIARNSFDMTSHAREVLSFGDATRSTFYFVGGTPDEINGFIQKVRKGFPNIIIAGAHSGYFSDPNERDSVISKIVESRVKFVIVGMGALHQETFLLDLLRAGWIGTGFTCGGFFKQTAHGELEYYPPIINLLHMRWAYRIYREPSLWSRYLKKYPFGMYFLVLDALRKRHSDAL